MNKKIGNNLNNVRILSYEKMFTMNRQDNPQNSHCICLNSSDVPPIMPKRSPAFVMVSGVISNHEKLMPPVSKPQRMLKFCRTW